MASPEVWTEARARLEGAGLGVPIAWPNEAFAPPEPPAPFVVVEISGDVSEPLELGPGAVWQEHGTLWCHVMTPAGVGIADALVLRKQIANLFRGLPPAPVVWRGAQMDPGGMSDDGAWHRLTLGVHYTYQDR